MADISAWRWLSYSPYTRRTTTAGAEASLRPTAFIGQPTDPAHTLIHMSRTRLSLLAVAAVLVLVGAIFVVVDNNAEDGPSGGVASERTVSIDAAGTTLSALVVTPKDEAKPALVVMPASWGQPATQYRPIARQLAAEGFLVVAYAQRGFGGSGGTVDLAGAATQADVGRVITWALRRTDADPKRVGLYGMSYGAGVSLLAAARDPRIKAVVALSTWTDLAASYDPNDTPSTRGLATLLGTGSSSKLRGDSAVTKLRTLLRTDPAAVGPYMRTLSATRSPASSLAQLNRNKTAVMLGNAFQDSLFGSQQLISFYQRLSGQKRLQLAGGDHGSPEAAALQGRSTTVTTAAAAWLDHFLRGADNGIAAESPIVLSDAATGAVHTLTRWPRATATATIPLGAPNSKAQTGADARAAWRSGIATGKDTVATSGPLVAPFSRYTPPTANLLDVRRQNAFVWTGPAASTPRTLAGTPQVRLNLGSTRSAATVISYLYDIDTTGKGQLMSVQPYTMTGLRRGELRPVIIDMQPIAWTLPSGHRLVLVIDTVDPRYTGLNPAGAQIVAASTTASPATLSLPSISS